MGTRFESTAWSVISAAQGEDSAAARAALEELCSRYWLPLYVYVRRHGYARPEAEDLTQDFFVHIFSHDFFAGVHPEKGRFRTFLLACMNHFMRDEWARQHAARRGGDRVPFSLDFQFADKQHDLLHIAGEDPHKAFDRHWAETLLDTALGHLEAEYRDAGKLETFHALQFCLGRGGEDASNAEASTRLGLSNGAVRVAVHRMRKRFAELTRAEIARTVDGEALVQAELNYLIEVMSG